MNPLDNIYETIDIFKPNIKLAYDKIGKQICVIKERNLKLLPLYQILREINIPYVPEIYRLVKFDEKLFVVEEYISGQTLLQLVRYEQHIDEQLAAEILRQVCEALKILHGHRIIHRDLKPSNIMLTRDGVIRLIDFSISRIKKDDSDTDTEFLGTRGYASPEQYGFGQTDSRSDIYSLGVTISRLLGSNYNGWLKKIIARCTKLDPMQRYYSAENLLADLDRRKWQQHFKQLKKNSGKVEPEPEPELDTYEKLDSFCKQVEDIDLMINNYLEADSGTLQARLIEQSALQAAEELEKFAHSFTDEDFAEMHAALEEFPLVDSDTEID